MTSSVHQPIGGMEPSLYFSVSDGHCRPVAGCLCLSRWTKYNLIFQYWPGCTINSEINWLTQRPRSEFTYHLVCEMRRKIQKRKTWQLNAWQSFSVKERTLSEPSNIPILGFIHLHYQFVCDTCSQLYYRRWVQTSNSRVVASYSRVEQDEVTFEELIHRPLNGCDWLELFPLYANYNWYNHINSETGRVPLRDNIIPCYGWAPPQARECVSTAHK